jgi:quercetin dioxygenase-like cupin family protein
VRGFRALVIAAVAGLLPAVYFAAWFKWPAFLAVGVGAIVALGMVMVIASIGSPPASEDAAWREAAPDLMRRPGDPGPTEHPASQPSAGATSAPGANTESTLSTRLRDEGLAPSSWSNGPREVYGAHEHGYDKVLVVAAGSITFGLPASGDRIDLAIGDRLELPAGTAHDAVVGAEGVTCLEAHIPRGQFAILARHRAGSW